MTKHCSILCLAGDGIGPEIMRSTIAVLEAVSPLMDRSLNLEHADIGCAALAKSGSTIPQAVVEKARTVDGVILGPVSHNDYPSRADGGFNPSGELRKSLGLFANIRPARNLPGIKTPTGHALDLIIMRENLEGFYADRNMYAGDGEFMPVEGVALAVRRITREASLNIAKAAFEWAIKCGALRVAAVHKSNVLRMSDGLFLDCVREVARDYPQITYDEVLVDSAAALLVRDPERFDVIVTTNMFGDILSDLASELAGSLGTGASLNAGKTHAAAQAQHGSAPDIAGQDKANPLSLILSSAMLLRHLGEGVAADAIDAAVTRTLAMPGKRTRDLGGTTGCAMFSTYLCEAITTELDP